MLATFFAFFFFLSLNAMGTPSCQTPMAENATYDDLQILIKHCQITKIENLIPLLSPSHLNNYTVLHHSQSLHEASYRDPRAVLYGQDAKLIITFNGSPAQEHYAHLEIMQFRDGKSAFELRDIEFPEKESGATSFSEKNPELCVSCHYADPKPNWSPYPLWPGAYGGEDDDIYRPEPAPGQAIPDLHHGRYRFLAPRPQALLPNTTLASRLHLLNMQRLARKIGQFKRLYAYRFALLGAVGCFYASHLESAAAFLPEKIKKNFSKSYEKIYQDTTLANAQGFLSRLDYLKEIDPPAPRNKRIQELRDLYEEKSDRGSVSDHIVASLRYLVENRGLATDDWSMEILPGSFDFENGYSGITSLLKPLATELLTAPQDAQWRKAFLRPKDFVANLETNCQNLRKRSLKELESSTP